jgi:hypothetical protein
MQVVYGQPDGYLCTELALDDSASPPRLLAALSAHAELLHRIARSADPDLRAHHNYGVSDGAGFAAMGVVETLIHTFDVVRGLNPADQWRPPTDLAAPVIARLFPHAPSGDPADVLLYCCGRAALGHLWCQVFDVCLEFHGAWCRAVRLTQGCRDGDGALAGSGCGGEAGLGDVAGDELVERG